MEDEECRVGWLFVQNDFNSRLSNPKQLKLALQVTGRNPSDRAVEKYWSQSGGSMNYQRFCQVVQIEGKTKMTDLMKAFRMIDVNGDGFVTAQELQRKLTKRGEKMSIEELEAVISEVDKNKDGRLDYAEFCHLLLNTTDDCIAAARQKAALKESIKASGDGVHKHRASKDRRGSLERRERRREEIRKQLYSSEGLASLSQSSLKEKVSHGERDSSESSSLPQISSVVSSQAQSPGSQHSLNNDKITVDQPVPLATNIPYQTVPPRKANMNGSPHEDMGHSNGTSVSPHLQQGMPLPARLPPLKKTPFIPTYKPSKDTNGGEDENEGMAAAGVGREVSVDEEGKNQNEVPRVCANGDNVRDSEGGKEDSVRNGSEGGTTAEMGDRQGIDDVQKENVAGADHGKGTGNTESLFEPSKEGAAVEGEDSVAVDGEGSAGVEGEGSAGVKGEGSAGVEGEGSAGVEGEGSAGAEGDGKMCVEGQSGAGTGDQGVSGPRLVKEGTTRTGEEEVPGAGRSVGGAGGSVGGDGSAGGSVGGDGSAGGSGDGGAGAERDVKDAGTTGGGPEGKSTTPAAAASCVCTPPPRKPKKMESWHSVPGKGCFYLDHEASGNDDQEQVIKCHHYQLRLPEPTNIWIEVAVASPGMPEMDVLLFVCRVNEKEEVTDVITYTQHKVDQRWVCRMDLEAGLYALLPYTSGCHLKPSEEEDDEGKPLLTHDEDGTVTLTEDAKAAFKNVFQQIDLDGNGCISRTEFDFFNEVTSGEICDDEAWAIIQTNFAMTDDDEITEAGFLGLQEMAGRDEEGGEGELWQCLQGMGYNKQLQLRQACPFILEVWSEECASDLEIVDLQPLAPLLSYALCLWVVDGGVSLPVQGVEEGDQEGPFVYLYTASDLTTIVVENKSDKKVHVQLDVSQSINCICNRESTVEVLEVPTQERRIGYHLQPADVQAPHSVQCLASKILS